MAMPHSWWLRHGIKGTEPRTSAGLTPGGRLCQPHGAGAVGQRSLELQAGADLEFGEYFAQVPFDGPDGQEQLGGDLRVGQAVAGQAGDLGLLRGERVARFNSALAGGLAGGPQLALR